MPVAEADQLRIRQSADIGAADDDPPVVDAVEPADYMHQRALAHAGRADDRHHLADIDRQFQIPEHRQRAARDGVRLREPDDLEEALPRSRHRYLSASAGSTRDAWRAG